MASYLKIANSTKTKNYMLTNTYAKPYLKVSNSVLPLTTNTTSGMQLKVKNDSGITYRPMEYGSAQSQQSYLETGTKSATYKTSYVNSAGLSSTTALTQLTATNSVRNSTYTKYGTKTFTSISVKAAPNLNVGINKVSGTKTLTTTYANGALSIKGLTSLTLFNGGQQLGVWSFLGSASISTKGNNYGTCTRGTFNLNGMMFTFVMSNLFKSGTYTANTGGTQTVRTSQYTTNKVVTTAYSGISTSEEITSATRYSNVTYNTWR